ncbi:Uncharacterized protein BP5553_00650 [Venustampulla echinocandica]|uniref:Uncharacterized protein n=1 Tax=Venustampulla echinocandica TaxID=2656787 RepID=A0A370TYT4_9HELO|nr:Uncharacterized protein BP5553_00650 [Venustampulla echinocandica]RDL40671.1 Uncharacterized protein BP5553_00650 [Venustampulla echinocandica]
MGLQSFFNWRSSTAASNTDPVAEEDLVADVDEPPDHRRLEKLQTDFHKSAVRSQAQRKESLLTKALMKNPDNQASKHEIQVNPDSSRRRSMMSNASMTSTAELTSDGGLTSPARTSTPSPPPSATFTSFAPYSLAGESISPPMPIAVNTGMNDSLPVAELIAVSPKSAQPEMVVPPKKRTITFACGGGKHMAPKPAARPAPEPAPVAANAQPQQRVCKIKFACSGPKPSDKRTKSPADDKFESQPSEAQNAPIPKKSPRTTSQSSPRPHRDVASTAHRSSGSPVATRTKPKYIIADEMSLECSEATRFHEFASEGLQEDDWIREEDEAPKARLTINDTLKMENAIRQLGNEAEEEALEEDDDDDDDDAAEDDDDDDDDDEDDDDDDDEESDGNETDNEAGFADSDDESDPEGEFAFWSPGYNLPNTGPGGSLTYRPSAHRAASASSIESVGHMESVVGPQGNRYLRRRPIKIRPGTPELPDSTDFVCGTLDEDRPIENAYISCMEARKNAKRIQTPQDIDPSFPTSDLENEEDDDDDVRDGNDSEEHVWLHGKFEESDQEHHGRRRSTTARRKSPILSPRRPRSPPPKQRLRSPPPRKLFGHSPKRMRSPPPPRAVRSPATSPTAQGDSKAINFAPLASRPGLTHTKSLPRAPNAFGRQYRASRIAAASGNDTGDCVVRGAIDIVKGLERKRQRRKEKFFQKQYNNRGRKQNAERKPQPGKGAERMRELGLVMAGKTGVQGHYMMSA